MISTYPFERVAPESVGLSSLQLLKAANLVDQFVKEERVAGAVIAIFRQGKLAHLSTHGWQNKEKHLAMQENSLFRVYSMTKVITTVGLLQLYEQGKVGLEQEVRSILPCFEQLRIHQNPVERSGELVPPAKHPTVYDLLRHMAGLGYDPMWPLAEPRGAQTLQEFIEILSKIPLIEQPNRRFIYSLATDVIGRIIEVVSGLELSEYLKRNIFDPLGMLDTGFHVCEKNKSRLCGLYGDSATKTLISIEGGELDSLRYAQAHRCSGGGGLISSSLDMLRFTTMLLNQGDFQGVRVLGRKTVELMCADHLPPSHPAIEFTGKSCRYGLGVSVVKSLGESHCIGSVGEFGWGGAAGTMEWIDPAEQMVSLLMIQHIGALAKDLEHRFKAVLYAALMT